jgi:hypothetical protein
MNDLSGVKVHETQRDVMNLQYTDQSDMGERGNKMLVLSAVGHSLGDFGRSPEHSHPSSTA